VRTVVADIMGISTHKLNRIINGDEAVVIRKREGVDYGDQGLVAKGGEALFFEIKDTADATPSQSASLGLWLLFNEIDTIASNNEAINKWIASGSTLENLFFRLIPISPPDLRPISRDANGTVSIHPLNILYERLIRRSTRYQRLESMFDCPAKDMLLLNAILLVQKALSELFFGDLQVSRDDKTRLKGIVTALNSKEGRVRKDLLGKRVNFSARSVIASAPFLTLDEVGLPKKMALELFKPFLIKHLLDLGVAEYYAEALRAVESPDTEVWAQLENVLADKWVILNRAPSLHRHSIQAFKPKLVDGRVIRLHPLVCSAFNADFDGDQMAVHVLLTEEARREAELMRPSNNLISSLDSSPLVSPSHEMIIGLSYMTRIRDIDSSGNKIEPRPENSLSRLESLEAMGEIKIYTPILWYNRGRKPRITCLGRLLIGQAFSQTIDTVVGKKEMKAIISRAINELPTTQDVARALDETMRLSLKFATQNALSVCADDIAAPSTRPILVAEGNKFVADTYAREERGELTRDQGHELIVRRWDGILKQVRDDYIKEVGEDNPVIIMWRTGARVSTSQMQQLAVAKGLITNTRNEIVETPIVNSLRDGLTIPEYFLSCSGGRKSLADKVFVTPESGYLTRQLVTAARDLAIAGDDCKTQAGIWIPRNRAAGRYVHDSYTVLGESDDPTPVFVRSPITCEQQGGICRYCFGHDPATRSLVGSLIPIGVRSAESLTEPATQMSMRTFHTGGSANVQDSALAIKAKRGGKVTWSDEGEHFYQITVETSSGEVDTYPSAKRYTHFQVEHGDTVCDGGVVAIYSDDGFKNADIAGSLPIIKQLFCAALPKTVARAVIAPFDGHIRYEAVAEKNEVRIFIDETFVGISKDQPVFYPENEFVSAGTFLTGGKPHVGDFFELTNGNLNLSFKVFAEALDEMYGAEGLTPNYVNYEVMFRSMTEIVELEDKSRGLRSHDKAYSRILIHGVAQVGVNYPSWLKSIGFGWIKRRLESAVSGTERSYGTRTERIMAGLRIPSPIFDVSTTDKTEHVETSNTLNDKSEIAENKLSSRERDALIAALMSDLSTDSITVGGE